MLNFYLCMKKKYSIYRILRLDIIKICGLDSIIQAAGRCNRERRKDLAYVYVFDFADEEYKVNKSSPFGNYLGQRQSLTEIIVDKYEDVTRPEAIQAQEINYVRCKNTLSA